MGRKEVRAERNDEYISKGWGQCEDEQKKEREREEIVQQKKERERERKLSSRRRRERERGNCPVVKLLFIYKSLKCSFCLLELTKRTRWNASSEVETFF